MSDIHLTNINGQLVAFCKTSDFKSYVRSAINDEMFWRDILQRYSVQSLVRDELNNSLPSQVRLEADCIVNKLVNDKLKDYTQFQIPSHVAKALSEQVTRFLNNNVQMNQILAQQSASLNHSLSESAAATLHRVVNESTFHETTRLHVAAQKQIYDEKLKEISDSALKQLYQQEDRFKHKMTEMEEKITGKLVLLDSANEKIRCLHTDLDKKEERIKVLEKSNRNVKTGLICTAALSLGTVIYLASRL